MQWKYNFHNIFISTEIFLTFLFLWHPWISVNVTVKLVFLAHFWNMCLSLVSVHCLTHTHTLTLPSCFIGRDLPNSRKVANITGRLWGWLSFLRAYCSEPPPNIWLRGLPVALPPTTVGGVDCPSYSFAPRCWLPERVVCHAALSLAANWWRGVELHDRQPS